MANAAYYQLVGHRDIIGKPLPREAIPELATQGSFLELLERRRERRPTLRGPGRACAVYAQGKPDDRVDFITSRWSTTWARCSGIMVLGFDITQQRRE